MRKLMVVLAILFYGAFIEVRMAEAQDRGYAMIRTPVATGAELADSILSPTARSSGFLRASPAQYLTALQAADPSAELKTLSDIKAYLSSLSIVRCPTGKGVLSRVLLPSGRLDFSWERDFEEGEMCLYNNNTNRLILSLTCGNTVMSPRTLTQVPRSVERIVRDTIWIRDTVYIRVPAPAVKDTIRVLVTKDSVVFSNGHRLFMGNLGRVGKGEFVRQVYETNGATVLIAVTDMKSGGCAGAFLGGLALGGIGGYLIPRGNETSCGGPVNPPNRIADTGRPLITIPFRIP